VAKRRGTIASDGPPDEALRAASGDKAALRRLASRHAEAAVAALAAVMADENATPAARVSAATALLAWGFGRSSAEDAEAGRDQEPARIVKLVWGGPPLGAGDSDAADTAPVTDQ
jgi:hypothetical protein